MILQRFRSPLMAITTLILASVFTAGPPPAEAQTSRDVSAMIAALNASTQDAWADAHSQAATADDPIVDKIVLWLQCSDPTGGLPFTSIADFIASNPDWPNQALLRRRAEEALDGSEDASYLINLFSKFYPITTQGKVAYIEALLRDGKTERAIQRVQDTWVDGDFTQDNETQFLSRFGNFLTANDYDQRVDQLIWDGELSAAERILAQTTPAFTPVASARISLRRGTTSPDVAFRNVPDAQRTDPALIYEAVRWYRRNGNDNRAIELLQVTPSTGPHSNQWWKERFALARRLLADGDAENAYKVVDGHGLTDGADFAEAEWLAGWTALRYLSEPDAALHHFTSLSNRSGSPISRSRGAYWSGRANIALGNRQKAETWFQQAALYPTAFYGQVAATIVRPGTPLALPSDPVPDERRREKFDGDELARAARILAASGRYDLVRPFLLALASKGPSPEWKLLASQLANQLNRPDFGVAIAKQAVREGHILIASGYPVLPPPAEGSTSPYNVEYPLVLAVVRQESTFDREALSPVGARGLMQLMPATARDIATQLSLPYATDWLTSDSNYNISLGQAYLGKMVNMFSGSYVLALSAYNAGPGRARDWLKQNGDPRGSVDNAIDWIERVPFSETKNYIQRAIENVQVYRDRITGGTLPLAIDQDLLR